MRTLSVRVVSTMVLAWMAGLPCLAADAVTDDLQRAYAPYRVALFRTNGSDVAAAREAMDRASTAWAQVQARHAAPATAPYDRDPAFGATLRQVQEVYAQAGTAIDGGRLSAAHEALEQARELLSALRQRNGVVVYSDHMNAYHEEMEHLLAEAPRQLDSAAGWQALGERCAVMAYLAQRLRSQAPAAWQADAIFGALLRDVETSLQALRTAVRAQDAAAAKAALGRVKPAYSKLFVQYG